MSIVLAFLAAFGLSYLGTRLLLRRTPASAFVDVPNARSSHDRPKPRFGGIAIVGAFVATFAAACVFAPELREYIPLCAGATLLFGAGLIDDWRGLGVGARLGVQCAAAAVAMGTGTLLERLTLPVAGTVELGWLAYPLTLLVFLASVNFYNFIDGIDGLAAGGAVIAGTFLAAAAMMVQAPALAILCAITAASALGFLQFNFPPSRLFMGDGGSTFLGYCFAGIAVAGSGLDPGVPVFVPALLLSSLYADAGLTIVRRLSRGEKVFQPHRTHYYQRLLQLGFNHKQVTLVEYLIMLLLGVSALLYMRAGGLLAPFASGVWLALFTLAILKIRALERGDRLFWERRTLFLITADVVAIVAAYLGAYFLRMNFQFTEAEGRAVLRALPIVVVVRSACFFKYGLYRSMWRYTGVADVVRVIKAVTTGSAIILAAVVLLYRFVAFPRTLFLIEYFLLVLFILGARFGTRLFHEIGREPESGLVRRYGVIGAGDEGERALREIRAQGPSVTVACFVDDDPRRVGLAVQGVPVEGPGARLEEVARRRRLDALVYALPAHDEASAAVWAARSRAAGIPLERAPGGADASAEPHAIVLDRAVRALGRPDASPSSRAQSMLRGRRVLVTHGGERIGTSLLAALRALGAVPVLHCDGTGGRALVDADSVGTCTGSLLADAGALIEAAAPDVVLHVVTVEPPGGLNDGAFAWEHLVRESAALAHALWRRPGCRLVIAALWGHVRAGDDASRAAATMEAVILNRAEAEAAAVVRLPRVLTASALTARAPASKVAYDLLENEAALLVIEVAAGALRGIYAPSPRPELSVADAREAALQHADAVPSARAARAAAASALLFPSEHLDECGVDAGRRVLSPLFPAAEPFRRLVVTGEPGVGAGEREEWERAVGRVLQPRAYSGAGRDPRTTA
jgi:UDP-N-acetylmuramyl pentapeptide phosphotransferase/UDP-N-acetylglucosamine-1-phosphate transferase